MSAAEILAELPRLTPEERTAIRRRLRELEEADGLLFLQEAADLMFRDADNREESDAILHLLATRLGLVA